MFQFFIVLLPPLFWSPEKRKFAANVEMMDKGLSFLVFTSQLFGLDIEVDMLASEMFHAIRWARIGNGKIIGIGLENSMNFF